MSDLMTRVFHPIGQGAYYSERHESMNIVFDCGEWKDSNKAENLVKNSFQNGSFIDILFISHFDFDHISKIETLRYAFKVKNCVLPLLHQEQIEILRSYFASQRNESARRLVEDPVSYFGDQTKIIFVEFGENASESGEVIDLDALSSGAKVSSGKGIRVDDWLYIPFNINQTQRVCELEALFQKSKLDFDLFKVDLGYGILNRTKIKSIYNKLSGGINFNSMLVYSGPAKAGSILYDHHQSHHVYTYDCHHLRRRVIEFERTGCIFTGDSNLNRIDLQRVFGKHWQNVGTIQIPHHGDINSFDARILSKDKFIFPVSYGTTNSYGHPADQVIIDIVNNGSIPIHVNENSDSIYIQIIQK